VKNDVCFAFEFGFCMTLGVLVVHAAFFTFSSVGVVFDTSHCYMSGVFGFTF